MARPPTQGPTDRELDILHVLWAADRSNVRDVHRVLSENERLSFTSVQTMLQIMYDKGLVDRELQGRSYQYWALVTQAETQRSLVSNLIDRAFGGSARALVTRALDAHPASAEELAQIKDLIEASQQVEAGEGRDD